MSRKAEKQAKRPTRAQSDLDAKRSDIITDNTKEGRIDSRKIESCDLSRYPSFRSLDRTSSKLRFSPTHSIVFRQCRYITEYISFLNMRDEAESQDLRIQTCPYPARDRK